MRYLLDTHVLIWTLRDPEQLSETATELIANRDNELLVSAISAFEIATKFHIGKLNDAEPIIHRWASNLTEIAAHELDITSAHALLAGQLDWLHRDPFDRMLAAQSLSENIPLITSDDAFRGMPSVTTIW